MPRRRRQALPLLLAALVQGVGAVLSTHVGAHSPLPTPVETWRQTAEGLCPAANVQRDVCRTAHHRLLVPHGIPV